MKCTALFFTFAAMISAPVLAPGQTTQTESLISTGRVLDVGEGGSMIMRVDQSGVPLLFHRLDQTPIFFADGRRATFADIKLQQHATVYYQLAGKRWVVGKTVIANPLPSVQPAPALTAAELKALDSPAANDGDITTQPGAKARIDNDITTKPGSKDPAEHDITRKPAR